MRSVFSSRAVAGAGLLSQFRSLSFKDFGLPPYQCDYFTLFDVSRELDPSRFDTSAIQSAYRKLQTVYHPDQHHALDSHIQRLANSTKVPIEKVSQEAEAILKDGSSYVGAGAATLRDPYRRARYMMHLINAEERAVARGWEAGGAKANAIQMRISDEEAFALTRTCDNAERDKGGAPEGSEEADATSVVGGAVDELWQRATQGAASSSVRTDVDFLQAMFEHNVELSEIKEEIEPALAVPHGSTHQTSLKELKEKVAVDDNELMATAIEAFASYASARRDFESAVDALSSQGDDAKIGALRPYASRSAGFKVAVLKWTYTQNLLRGIKEVE